MQDNLNNDDITNKDKTENNKKVEAETGKESDERKKHRNNCL